MGMYRMYVRGLTWPQGGLWRTMFLFRRGFTAGKPTCDPFQKLAAFPFWTKFPLVSWFGSVSSEDLWVPRERISHISFLSRGCFLFGVAGRTESKLPILRAGSSKFARCDSSSSSHQLSTSQMPEVFAVSPTEVSSAQGWSLIRKQRRLLLLIEEELWKVQWR